jgi:N-acetylglucosaminyl-diphospho-decaprenol L-rhamnosyltransferase
MLTRAVRKLSICIVNWNSGSQLRDCIASIGQAETEGFFLDRVVVVDNGSTDNSLAGIDHLGVAATTIRNSVNRGFAFACNQAAAAASGDYFLFLNPDTRVFKTTLTVPVCFMERPENAHIGICGIQLLDELGKECLSYAKFPSLCDFARNSFGVAKILRTEYLGTVPSEPSSEKVRFVDQVIGAFFMVRSSVFRELGGFDERFFVYFEEVDFALRARQIGHFSVCLGSAQCIHIGQGSSRQIKGARLFYSLRSRVLYGFKHFSLVSAIALLILTLGVEFVSRSALALARGAIKEFGYVAQGYLMLFRHLPRIVKVAAGMRNTRA